MPKSALLLLRRVSLLPMSGSNKKKRKRSTKPACVHCHKAHTACSGERPCLYCVKHNTADTCTDAPRKRRPAVQCMSLCLFTNFRGSVGVWKGGREKERAPVRFGSVGEEFLWRVSWRHFVHGNIYYLIFFFHCKNFICGAFCSSVSEPFEVNFPF